LVKDLEVEEPSPSFTNFYGLDNLQLVARQ